VTAAGRGVAVVLMLVGIGLIGVLTATVVSFFVQETADKQTTDLKDLQERLGRIERMLEDLTARQSELSG
jgi:voltage-gated potassium channel